MSTPLLLNAPKQMIRDAARAVKRKAGLMVQRVTTGTLSRLLGLPGMVITEYALEQALEGEGEREVLHIFCEHEHDVALCPKCGQVTQKVHDRKERSIRHLDIWGKRTFVHFRRGVLTVSIAKSPSGKNCLGSKVSVGRV